FAAVDDRTAAEDAAIAWVMVDVGARAAAGSVGADKIFVAVGPARAGPPLVRIASEPGANRNLACDLLGKFGDPASRDHAGQVLVRIARNEQPPREHTFKCIGQRGGPADTGYLLEKAEKADENTRLRAIRALEQHPDVQALPFAARMARDNRQPAAVRDEAFGLIEAVGGDA